MTAIHPVRTFTAPRALGETLADPCLKSPGEDRPSVNGVNGANHVNGTNGTNGTNGVNGVNGSPQTGNNTLKPKPAYPRVPPPGNRKMAPEGGITFSGQDSLPKLPIPELEQTCERYLTALKPLQSPREHADTRNAVLEFLKNDGPELQEKLKKYAQGKTSYIEQFWYDSYLNFDNPVVLNLNPFFLLEDDPTPARNNQVTRAASLAVSALEFVRAVRKEELPADTVKGTPLCMYQFSRLFGTARVPTDAGCRIEQDPESKHVVVLCHGQFYWFDVLDDNSDLIMTERDIAINLQTIIDDATQTPIQEAAKSALGVLSTENRKVWSGLRDLLTREEGSNNAECLAIVDTALFVMCLDYTEPATAPALCGNMLCGTSEVEKGVQIGTCTNRWYDKLQIIVCKNGSAGINFEHTGVDGHTVLRFASDLYTDTILRFARTINGKAPTLWASTSPDPSKRDPESFGDVSTTPHKLEWDMTPELNIAVRFAETRLADLIEQNEFECLDFSAYGKNFITSMGLSPDAFVQMAFQAAYFGLYGRVECTYEPAMTKKYLHGRTEAIRTVSEETVNFVQTFWADHPADQKVDALRTACQRHVSTTRECLQGQGCDRHLYALFCVWQKLVDDETMSDVTSNGYSSSEGYSDRDPASSVGSPAGSAVGSPVAGSPLRDQVNGETISPQRSRGDSQSSASRNRELHPLPLLFADPGWDKLNTTIMSTSNCGNPSLRQFGFGPTSGDGFGIGYIIKDESMSICVSSRHRQTRRFIDTLESYLLEIRRILRITSRKTSTTSRATRAREIDDDAKPKNAHRPKPRGRMITGMERGSSIKGTMSPPEDSLAMSDDELGGYGFFDAGMLLQALKARGEHPAEGETKPSERAAVQARRRVDVGKKLRLTDY
ncbi:probable carnitine acetyl transferase FacC [Cephalotrichum gorgonifer]|uniref:Probable carnitine acetyl transferase FacC n=1 Tax=Cephalotrichum gorgonifer TaxID=2041049 RepID=A0AAE8SYG5_9PEZI|nr:probable carnitine acetyl transferase FacC [Cephalotrichum gorgonifer]